MRFLAPGEFVVEVSIAPGPRQVRFSPSAKQPLIVSCGWDKLVKVWNLNNCKLRYNLAGHSAPLYASTISPDGSLCASAGVRLSV